MREDTLSKIDRGARERAERAKKVTRISGDKGGRLRRRPPQVEQLETRQLFTKLFPEPILLLPRLLAFRSLAGEEKIFRGASTERFQNNFSGRCSRAGNSPDKSIAYVFSTWTSDRTGAGATRQPRFSCRAGLDRRSSWPSARWIVCEPSHATCPRKIARIVVRTGYARKFGTGSPCWHGERFRRNLDAALRKPVGHQPSLDRLAVQAFAGDDDALSAGDDNALTATEDHAGLAGADHDPLSGAHHHSRHGHAL